MAAEGGTSRRANARGSPRPELAEVLSHQHRSASMLSIVLVLAWMFFAVIELIVARPRIGALRPRLQVPTGRAHSSKTSVASMDRIPGHAAQGPERQDQHEQLGRYQDKTRCTQCTP